MQASQGVSYYFIVLLCFVSGLAMQAPTNKHKIFAQVYLRMGTMR